MPLAGDNNAGRLNSRTYTKAGTTISSDAATYSRSGKRITATSDASGANWTYGYDGAGRLTTAGVSMGAASDNFTYSYGPATCGETYAGAGGNITRRTTNATTIDYCYDRADRLTTMKLGGLDYVTTHDNRGNQLTLGNQNYTYDASDRATGVSQNGAGSATYTRDAANRIISRTVSGSAIQFSFANGSDAPVAAYGTTGALLERYVGLLGGVMVRTTVYGWEWSLSNIAGSVVAQTSMNGTKIGTTTVYDPFGNAATALPNNRLGTFDAGWLGTANRFTDQTADFAAIPMGARLYIPILNRFTQVDPVLGGVDNDYVWPTDPVNGNDVSGEWDPRRKELSGEERRALDEWESTGRTSNPKALNRARAKQRYNEKRTGDRNEQKRKSERRGKGTNKYINIVKVPVPAAYGDEDSASNRRRLPGLPPAGDIFGAAAAVLAAAALARAWLDGGGGGLTA